MRILHVIASLDPAAGGPPIVATRLAAAQRPLGARCTLLSYHEPHAQAKIDKLLAELPGGALPVETVAPRGRLDALTLRSARAQLDALVRRFDVVHLHGVWEPLLPAVADAARRARVPYVVTPHGMLGPHSLAQKALKKRIALALRYRAMLNGAAFLHTLNVDERDPLAPLRLRCPTEIIPNGIFPEELEPAPVPGAFRKARPELGDDPYLLYLGRLQHAKGLDLLADAFAILAKTHPRLRLVVAGPDFGFRERLEAMIAAHGVQDRTHLVGPVYGRAKYEAINDAAVFVLASRQECFSMAITEALGCGRPVVISRESHFPEVETERAGRIVSLDAKDLARGIAEVLADPAAADDMGRRGAAMVRDRFTWPRVAQRTLECYARHGARERPA